MSETGSTIPALAGKVAMVTGAASGMGAVMARALLAAGARVAGVDVNPAGLEELQREAADAFASFTADVSVAGDCSDAIEAAIDRFGAVDILINNAGVEMTLARLPGHTGPLRFWESDPNGWQRIIAINAIGPYLMARHAVPHMIKAGWGRVVNVTTSFDTMMAPGLSAYGQSKAALEAGTAIWAKELDGTGVTVNVLVPGGPTDTPLLPAEARHLDLLRPEIMGPPVQWLASPLSDGITGCRFIARDWDVSLPAGEAATRARAPAAWPDLATQARGARGG